MSTAIEKKKNQALAVKEQVPEFLQSRVGQLTGLEDVGQDDVLIPRLSVAQALSPQLKKSNEAFIPGLEQGQFFNTLTGEIYGEEVTVIPLFYFRQFIKFKPIEDGGGIVAMYKEVGDVPPAELAWGANGEKPVTTEFKSEMCLVIHEDGREAEPVIVSFKSTGMTTAKIWNSLMRSAKLPAYAKRYNLKVVEKTKGEQSWWGVKVTPGAFVDEKFFAAAEQYFGLLRQKGFKVDTTGLGDEEQAESPSTPF